MTDPRITDNDAGEITASVYGEVVRSWSYENDAERRVRMLWAHEFAEGWFLAMRGVNTDDAKAEGD